MASHEVRFSFCLSGGTATGTSLPDEQVSFAQGTTATRGHHRPGLSYRAGIAVRAHHGSGPHRRVSAEAAVLGPVLRGDAASGDAVVRGAVATLESGRRWHVARGANGLEGWYGRQSRRRHAPCLCRPW